MPTKPSRSIPKGKQRRQPLGLPSAKQTKQPTRTRSTKKTSKPTSKKPSQHKSKRSATVDAPDVHVPKRPGKRSSSPRTAKWTPAKRGKVRQLVIVESPAKAKTINKYLGPDFVVQASVGHVRDLPAKAEKGDKQPVPGVDLEHDFRPTYVVLPGKTKAVAELQRLAKSASEVWFATDLDREGEAIAWHISELLGIAPSAAKRVVFNAITQQEVQRAFANPHVIDENKVNAQQARRILDRIVGYQVSPLLWKKVARGLSAGRVQSVAVRLIVEREREIRAFVPDEYWRVNVNLGTTALARKLEREFAEFLVAHGKDGELATQKAQQQWTAEHGAVRTELYELAGEKFELTSTAQAPRDLTSRIREVAELVGMRDVTVETAENPEGKGPAGFVRVVTGTIEPSARYRVLDSETKRTSSRPSAPFITSSMQIAAANQLGLSAQRIMRIAQALYEGVEITGEGHVGLITYMRTDSTNISSEAVTSARRFVEREYGSKYVPERPNVYTSANKDAQEAHEAIRPTEIERTPESLQSALTEEQYKLYRLIWSRFVACQMTPAQWDSTSVTFVRHDRKTGAVLRTTGRVLVFDGFYKASGVPSASEEQTLPELRKAQELAPFHIECQQRFTNPPPRYSEASLVKTLEAEGIGRPSTYASIIQVVQDRKYVEQLERRFYSTDLGEVVTDKLLEAFPDLMDVGYTRQMEAQLDKIEDEHLDWVDMLRRFYGRFSTALENAHDVLTHAKAESQPAIYKCPECGARTAYRFGKNGRFLSCTSYPECSYSAPIDRQGRPLLPERVNVRCPDDGSEMELRVGRFGPFLASVRYPDTSYVINLDKKGGIKLPARPPMLTDLTCPKCASPLNLRRGKRGPWLGCSTFPKCRGRVAWSSVDEPTQKRLESQLRAHERKHPLVSLETLDGKPITEGMPVAHLVIPGKVLALEIHPDALQKSA